MIAHRPQSWQRREKCRLMGSNHLRRLTSGRYVGRPTPRIRTWRSHCA